jgi:hypothetical protein
MSHCSESAKRSGEDVADFKMGVGRFNTYLEDVVPTHGKTPGRIDEADRVRVEATRNRVQNSKFTESVDDVEHHDTNDQEVNENPPRTLDICQYATAVGNEARLRH